MLVLATESCLSWLVFFSEMVYISITLFFKPKMDLISTTCIIVLGFFRDPKLDIF